MSGTEATLSVAVAGLGATFDAAKPTRMKGNRRRDSPRLLSAGQQAEVAQIVETGLAPSVDGV